jgi:UDPglucose 6-dehydrogenase
MGFKVKSLGIIGNGFVGHAIYEGMKQNYDVMVYDIDPEKSHNTIEDINKSNFVFLCVPTPMKTNGEFDVSIVETAVKMLDNQKTIIVKSTITPKAAKQIVDLFPQQNFVFNPEFLTERTAVRDFKNPSRIVIGGDDKEVLNNVEAMYRVVFPSRLVQIIKTDAQTACFIKYFSNCFFAAKVSLMNEFRQISDAAGINWDVALEGLLTSGWVNPMHTLVPGPDGNFGFGGKCFPKDINAFINYSNSIGVDPKLLKAAWEKNLEIREDKNWLQIKGTITNDDQGV